MSKRKPPGKWGKADIAALHELMRLVITKRPVNEQDDNPQLRAYATASQEGHRMSRRITKKRHRPARRRRATATVDIETRSPIPLGDNHYQQVMAYARAGGLTEFVVAMGGDLIHGDGRLHEDQHFTGERWKP